jgi:LuxR family maltose regulon positive regulatory protein
MQRLDASLDVPMTLISAPAGSGKTRLVTEWIRARQQAVAWVSLDGADADPARFVAYVVEAIRTLYPDAAAAGRMILNLPTPLSVPEMAEALLRDLEALPGPLMMVLDDFHEAESAATIEFLQRLLRIPPPLFHLILTTRSDPGLPLARMRSQYQLLEIRNANLRFSDSEATEFLAALAGEPVADAIAAQLQAYIEGWPVGLQLAGILLQSAKNQREFTAQFTAHSHHWIAEYLVTVPISRLDTLAFGGSCDPVNISGGEDMAAWW